MDYTSTTIASPPVRRADVPNSICTSTGLLVACNLDYISEAFLGG